MHANIAIYSGEI